MSQEDKREREVGSRWRVTVQHACGSRFDAGEVVSFVRMPYYYTSEAHGRWAVSDDYLEPVRSWRPWSGLVL